MRAVILGNDTKEEIEKRLQIVASAANLSRAEGTVIEVFDSRVDFDKNVKLAKAVLGYGHKSISEHDYIVIGLENVTPIVEQTLIGYRLTSFTIKSRRNVDFRSVGHYTPTFRYKDGRIHEKNIELQKKYNEHVEGLFSRYGDLVDEALPIEDCRYILPYCFFSNGIMGADCNEWIRIVCDLLYGKLSKIDELRKLGEIIKEELLKVAPYLERSIESEKDKTYYKDQFTYLDEKVENSLLLNHKLIKKVKLTDYKPSSDEDVLCSIISSRYGVSKKRASLLLYTIMMDDDDMGIKMMNSLYKSKNQRELEQVNFSFEMSISLASLTHITRHRMHSLLVPDFAPLWNLNNYVMPKTIEKKHEDEYKKIFEVNKEICDSFRKEGVRDEDLIYFYLSGNACNISTTMNARTLAWISRMRCCNKAQWEIRDLVWQMVNEVKKHAPLIGMGLGPYCKVEGYCPEGRDSCKERGVVVKELKKNKK